MYAVMAIRASSSPICALTLAAATASKRRRTFFTLLPKSNNFTLLNYSSSSSLPLSVSNGGSLQLLQSRCHPHPHHSIISHTFNRSLATNTSASPIEITSDADTARPPSPINRKEKFKDILDVDTALNMLRAYSVTNHTVDVILHVSMRDPALKKSRERDPVTGVVIYPHSFQKGKKIVVLCTEDEMDNVTKAGADHVGGTELVEKVVSSTIDFELLLASQSILPKLKKFGGQLRALMPSTKKGTASDDVASLVKQHKAGQAFKSDKSRNIVCAVAKIDFTNEQITENLASFLATLMEQNLLGQPHLFVKRMFIRTSQSPCIELPSRKVLENLL